MALATGVSRLRRQDSGNMPTSTQKELEKLARKLDRQQTFFLRGDEYARPKGHTDDALSGWYNRRSFSIACEREYDELSYSRDLLDAVKAGYEFLIPYYEYFDKSYRMAD